MDPTNAPEADDAAQPKYSLHAEANGIFAFLKETFPQMPKPVQVAGWCVFLFLFVFLTMYEFLGVSYFSGEVSELTKDESGQNISRPVGDLTIERDNSVATVVTNKKGRFVAPVLGFVPPFWSVEFSFTKDNSSETVGIRYVPLVSTFNPNPTKIYYVAGSHKTGHFAVQHYFLDESEAIQAYQDSLNPRAAGPAALHLSAGPDWPGGSVVHAAAPPAAGQAYLRLSNLASSNIGEATSVYFDIRIDGNKADAKGLPDGDSPASARITLLPGIATRLDGAEIALPPNSRNLSINVFGKRRILSDLSLGAIAIAVPPVNGSTVGRSMTEKQNGLQVSYEILPPIALLSTGIRSNKTKFIRSQFWLQAAPEFLQGITKVRYDLGSSFAVRYIESPVVTASNNFGYGINIYSPQTVSATLSLAGGSTMSLTVRCDATPGDSRSSLDEAFRAKDYYVDEQYDLALQLTNQVLQSDPKIQWLTMQKATILGRLKKYDDALAEFDRALGQGDPPPGDLNTYAWFIATLPNPTARQLEDALRRSQRSLEPNANPNYLDTEGWIYYKLKNYGAAQKALETARDLQAASNAEASPFQEIQYHLGKTLLELNRTSDAKKCFQEVLKFGDRRPDLSNQAYADEARRLVAAR